MRTGGLVAPPPFAAPVPGVDRVDTSGPGGFVAVKTIDASDPYLVGHYPGFPIYPGAFTVETVYQAACRVIGQRLPPGARADLLEISSAQFSAPLFPDDVLYASADITGDGEVVRVAARCTRRDGSLAAKVTISLRVSDA